MTEPTFGRQPDAARTAGSARQTIASYSTYQEAQAAVDQLSDAKFPVERVSIVGTGLRFEEQVTGRFSYGRAAVNGAATGAVIGVLFGWLFGAFNWMDPVSTALALALQGLIVGAVIGALIGLLAHAMTGGRRDFSSISGVRARQYEVQVDTEVAAEASRQLAAHHQTGQPADPQTGRYAPRHREAS